LNTLLKRTPTKIVMLRGLLCCFSEEKEDEPCVAYSRQDDRQEELRREEAPELVIRRSPLPPRGLGPAPSPCLPHADRFIFPRPKEMSASCVATSDICLPNYQTPISGAKSAKKVQNPANQPASRLMTIDLTSPMSLTNSSQHYQYHGAVPAYPGTLQPSNPPTGTVSVKTFPRSSWASSRKAFQPGLDLVCTSPWRGNHVLLSS